MRSRGLFVAALATLTIVGAGQAAERVLHSDPAESDNLRIYSWLGAFKALVSFDDAAATEIEGSSVMFAQLEPGTHKWSVSLPNGEQASAEVSLSAEGMIESKGRRWWCLGAGPRGGRLTLLQLSSAQCKTIADAGPD